MKIIKFRVWDIEEKQWMKEDISLSYNFDGSRNNYRADGLASSGIHFCQFTGLYDENDVEIYEGDLVEDEDRNIGKVCFEAGMFIIGTSKYTDHYKNIYEFFNHHTDANTSLKVIGNFYENKDMYNG